MLDNVITKKRKNHVADEEDISSKALKSNEQYDIILLDDLSTGFKKVKTLRIYLGKGISIETQEFQRANYINLSRKINDQVKNRFNLPLDLLPNLMKGIKHLNDALKNDDVK